MNNKPVPVKRRRRRCIPIVEENDEENIRAPDPVVYGRLADGPLYVPNGPPTTPEPDFMEVIEKSRREAEENEMVAAMELIAQMEEVEARERVERERAELMEREKGARMAICDAIMTKLLRLKTMGDKAIADAYCALEPVMNEYRLWGTTRNFGEDEKVTLKNVLGTVRFSAQEKTELARIIQ